MKNFKLIDNALGWFTFLVAAIVYCSTVEPTASFWDCPEFILTGYKLEIGHPPGAPFFMLTANLFSQFASSPSEVAIMVNRMSALLSATCILFLFWSITHLTRKLITNSAEELSLQKIIAIEASGLVGALIYTFSDTFWYSAVEGEVYAYSSAFTAVVFWLILKWEDCADEPHSDRWLVLIAYMTGLSIGVHLLNLLCIPAIVLVYYYKRFPNADLKGSLIALTISFCIITAVLYGVVPGIITVGGWFELFFVNTLGCSFNTGVIIYILVLISTVIWAIYESYKGESTTRENISYTASVGLLGIPFYGYGISAAIIGIVLLAALWFVLKIKRNKVLLVTSRFKNTTLLCMLMLMIGYSTYAVIVIRSSANPPMDQNSPEDIFTLGSYLSRDQYGYRPLAYGHAYTSEPVIDYERGVYQMKEGAPVYQRKEKASKDEKDTYFVVDHKRDYVYAQNMLFPRMYDKGHTAAYESWMGGVDGYNVPYEDSYVKMPTQLENLRFFLSYQCNFMYWRYFLWNFAGRQNDVQGNGELEHGNWLTGFSFIDNARLGNQETLPDDLKNNKGHNVFYCLPLLLGLIGLFWQAYRGQKGIRQFWVVFFLFFMTGLAIVIYLNQTPQQPRERDYAYAGSFYAFAIWCGMGVAAIIELIKRYAKMDSVVVASVVAALCLIVPIQMASQTWDDHDRSGRYTCRDFGQNYLMTLQDKGNPIIFTNGDNDTFPLWYNQEVEGTRTDTRVCNLSYLQTDWYIDQMKRPAYDSPAVPLSWPRIEYCSGTNDIVYVDPSQKSELLKLYDTNPEEAKKNFGDEPFELKNILKYWVRSKNEDYHYIPTDTVFVTIDKEAVKKSGMMLADSIPDKMVISLKGKRALYKGDLMMLEMISQCNWTRPIYIACTVGEDNYMNLGENLIQEGLANRITPFSTKVEGGHSFDTEKVYNNVMNRYKYGNLKMKGIYLDETVLRMVYTHMRLMSDLAIQLCAEGKMDKARNVLNKIETEIPSYNVPRTYINGGNNIARAYSLVGNTDKAIKVFNEVWRNGEQYLNWYMSLSTEDFLTYQRECHINFNILMQSLQACSEKTKKEKAWKDEHYKKFDIMYQKFISIGGKDMFGGDDSEE